MPPIATTVLSLLLSLLGDDRHVALVGGTVHVDPGQTIQDSVVLIAGRTIRAVGRRGEIELPEQTAIIDCTGRTVVAGFWNAHVHFFERKWADAAEIPAAELEGQLEQAFVAHGFTNVFDLTSDWSNTRVIRDRIESGEIAGPRIRSTGEGLVPPGALPPKIVLDMMGMMPTTLAEVSTPDDARSAVDALLARDVDGIKLFMSSPRGAALSVETVRAAVDTAHAAARPVFAHVNTAADVETAIAGGVDVIAHTTTSDEAWDLDTLDDQTLVPTLRLWPYQRRHDRLAIQEQMIDASTSHLRAWIDAGGVVLFGTDHGATPADPMLEFVLMDEAGMDAMEILASLTTAPAQRFGDPKREGRVAPGHAADVVVLDGALGQDPRTFADVVLTMRRGRVVFRADE